MSRPATLSKRELNRQTTIGRILQAARMLMEEAGEDAITLRKLARKSGLSPNTIYRHFGSSRDDIVNAIVSDALASVGPAEEEDLNLDVPGMAPWDHAIAQFLDNPAYFKAVTLFRTSDQPITIAQQHMINLRAKTRELLALAERDGLLAAGTDLDFMIAHFSHVMLGIADRWAKDHLDDCAFRQQILYSVYTALIAHATPRGRKKFAELLRHTTGQPAPT